MPVVHCRGSSYNPNTMSRKSPTPKPAPRDPFEDEFHRLLGRLVHAQARFDFNVGLSLNWMGPHYGREVTDLLDPINTLLGTRLRKLKALVLDAYEPAAKQALVDFKAWFEKADRARCLRNDYVNAIGAREPNSFVAHQQA